MHVLIEMTWLRDEPARYSGAKVAALTTLRALRSIVVIIAVVCVVVAFRDGEFIWAQVPRVVALNRTLFVMTFLGLWVWEYWFLRAKRNRFGPNGSG